ncbi:FecR domain-containing protein [Janthinobacterium sp. PC23-8]|uniref:FecR family protein n=1 Tax=Janthinobacterium sp. PC23-8 TaxID=2012679 RepID=UPI000B96B29B|nr:FecR family protein [Janthinobacterium sp. PC23-8]OYO30247.1 iron dicitrate transport regulator FecR [Janthinobacterium sp. PC23-8]
MLAGAMLWLVLMSISLHAFAQVAGTVTQLSGPMMAKKADGKVKILSLKSEVESGDTLITEKATYALVKFIDNSEITLKPGTTFVVEQFAYQAEQPDGDQASFNLVKGGLRSLSGLLGKRNKEKFSLKTPVATIGIRGTYFTAEYIGAGGYVSPLSSLAKTGAPAAPTLAPGLYTSVTTGQIVVSNPGGTLNIVAGQFGFTPTGNSPTMLVPESSGLQFTLPVKLGSNAPGAPNQPHTAPKSGGVDCEVR